MKYLGIVIAIFFISFSQAQSPEAKGLEIAQAADLSAMGLEKN